MAKSDLHVRLKSNGAYWQAYWTDSAGKPKVKSLGPKAELTKRAARVKCQRLAQEMAVNPAKRDQGKAPRLGEHLERYLKHRTDLRPRTKMLHRKTIEYLAGRTVPTDDPEKPEVRRGFFDPSVRIDQISRAMAADWRAWLATQDLSEQTVCGHVRTAKQIFARAVDEDLLPFNPFGKLKGKAPKVDKDWADVSVEDTKKLIEACPSRPWKTWLALSRFAGLRKSESLTLTWTDIDWEKRTITVLPPEGEVTTKKRRRVVPIEPELHDYLLKAFDEAAEGELRVVPLPEHNSHRYVVRYIRKAGLTPWAKPFHVLRKNRETEWSQQFPAHVVAEWMGHDIQVAAEHYLKVPEELYAKAAGIKAETREPQQEAAK